MQAVIIAGGKGTRLGELTAEIPKPLVRINGLPILEHQIRFLKNEGVADLIILTGHLGDKISEFVGDGSRFGVRAECIREQKPLGTAGCLHAVRERIDADFLLVYGDVILDVFLERFVRYHRSRNSLATLLVHPNDHPQDSDLVEMDENGYVTGLIPKQRHQGRFAENLVNAALYLLNPGIFRYIEPRESDFIKEVFPAALAAGETLAAYQTPEYIKDVGTPERIRKVSGHLQSGLVAGRNLRHAQRAIFLDRDGTINEEVNLLNSCEQMRLIPGAAEAVRAINQSGFLAVCVTNQPVIARNLCSLEELRAIHGRMSALLGVSGAYLDRLYYCPHHPDKGYPEERAAFKIVCNCRKPSPGMLLQAQIDMNIDLSRSYMIGDTTADIELGKRSGLRTVLVETGYAGRDGKYEATPDLRFPDLLEAVTYILNQHDH